MQKKIKTLDKEGMKMLYENLIRMDFIQYFLFNFKIFQSNKF